MDSYEGKKKNTKKKATRKTRVQNGKYYFLKERRSLETRRGKNIVWENKEVGLVMFWKRNRKIARNGMREMKNVN